MSGVVVAIDGPAASGKSSVARGVADRLRFFYVNSGNLYRAATWVSLSLGSPEEEDFASRLLEELTEKGLGFSQEHGVSRVLYQGRILDSELSEEAVNARVSLVAKLAEIREWVLVRLRSVVEGSKVVMEGRDIGSVVFPETPYKIYLDASPEVRQRRRKDQGIEDVILERDRLDRTRSEAPLKVASDAAVVDSSDLDLSQTVEAVLEVLRQRGLSW